MQLERNDLLYNRQIDKNDIGIRVEDEIYYFYNSNWSSAFDALMGLQVLYA
jgi:hypothetical protein